MKRRQHGPHVKLAAVPAEGGAWNVLAYEVTLKARGASLTRQMFEQCVKNFARYPKVPVVIEHADTTDGPAEWQEPHGWITELRVGSMERNGKTVATLEGRMQLDEATRPLVVGETPTWPFGSVTVYFSTTDEETNTDTGASLFSFSLTAHPALVDVPRLAASRLAQAREARGAQLGYWYGEIESREDIVSALRSIFELPAMEPESSVLASLTKLEALLAQPDPESSGIEVDDLVCALRSAMRLPALTTADEVIAAIRKGLAMPSTTQLSRGQRPAPPTEKQTMKNVLNVLTLAGVLGLAPKSEDEAREMLLTYAAEAPDVRKALSLAANAPVSDVVAAISKLSTDNATLSKKVTEQTAELELHRKAAAERADADRKAHIDELIAVKPELEPVRASLEMHAKSDWAGFQTAYPRPSATETVAARAAARADNVAEASARGQDAARLSRLAPPTRQVATDGASPSDDAAIQAAYDLMAEAEAQGLELSFSEALERLG